MERFSVRDNIKKIEKRSSHLMWRRHKNCDIEWDASQYSFRCCDLVVYEISVS